jgi:hypothetical protein
MRGGPLVVLCAGESCGHHQEAAGRAASERFRTLVRESRGGVLVSSGCLRRCPGEAVAMVGWQGGGEVTMNDPLVFAGVQDDDIAAAVADWVRLHDRSPGLDPLETLPLRLRARLIP